MLSTKKSALLGFLIISAITLVLTNIFTAPLHADNTQPISLVARLSFSQGSTSFLPAGGSKWVKTSINYPLSIGDRVWVGAPGFLELQLNNLTARLDGKTSLKLLNLNQNITQLQLSTGSMILRVWSLNPGQLLQVSTPTLAFSISRPGYYRISVDDIRKTTNVSIIEGSGKVYAAQAAYQMYAGKSCSFGLNLRMLRCTAIPTADAFERMSRSREQAVRTVARSSSRSYVSSNMIGYQDLDRYGRWRNTRQYGNVWTPTNVSTNWAPYRNGNWVWTRQWGWTWVDAQPWGFAPSHYGRWVYLESRWCWVPGPRYVEPVYAPALVVFVGGNRFNLRLSSGRSGIAWFPLAPGEVYVPPVPVSNNYFVNVNKSNTNITNINNITINQYTNNNHTLPANYKNMNMPNGVTAVTTETFKQSQPVIQATQTVSKEVIAEAPKIPVATVVPDSKSITGGAPDAQSIPPKEVLNQPAVVTEKPPAAPAPFVEEQKLLEKNPGEPLTAKEAESLQPAQATQAAQVSKTETAKEAPVVVEVVNPEQKVKPIEEHIKEQGQGQEQPAPEDKSNLKEEKPVSTEETISPDHTKPLDAKPEEKIAPAAEEVKPEISPKEKEENHSKQDEAVKPEEQIKPEEQVKPEEKLNPEQQVQPKESLQPEDQIRPDEKTTPVPQETAPSKEMISPEVPAQQPQPEIRPESEPKSDPEIKPQPEIQIPEVQAQPEPQQPESQPQPQPEPQAQPQPEPQLQPQPEPQTPQPEPQQAQPAPQPQLEPQPQAQPEPQS